MAAETVHIKGLRELNRAFRDMDKDVRRDFREWIKEGAEPVRREAQDLFRPINDRTAAGYRVAVRTRGVAIEQRIKKVTGQHPEYGARQMRIALLPALASRADELLEGIGRAFDRMADIHGF